MRVLIPTVTVGDPGDILLDEGPDPHGDCWGPRGLLLDEGPDPHGEVEMRGGMRCSHRQIAFHENFCRKFTAR